MVPVSRKSSSLSDHRTRLERLISWFNTSPLVQPIILIIALIMVAGLTFYLYPRTEDGTYVREIIVAAIGSLLTIIGAIAVALVAFRRQLRARRENRKIQDADADSWNKRHLKVGGMLIEDIVVVKSCRQDTPWTDLAVMEWKPTLQEGFVKIFLATISSTSLKSSGSTISSPRQQVRESR